jgi:hypothetical protein
MESEISLSYSQTPDLSQINPVDTLTPSFKIHFTVIHLYQSYPNVFFSLLQSLCCVINTIKTENDKKFRT